MYGLMKSFQSLGGAARCAFLQHARKFATSSSSQIEEHGFESAKIADILTDKGKTADGSWLWCTTDDTVYDAVVSMTNNNVGALMVVNPGEKKIIAGIITERDYLTKIIVQGRSSKETKVGDIMTEENKVITVTPETKVLRAMQLMTGEWFPRVKLRLADVEWRTDNRFRHIPVVADGDMVGMVSIGDVVKAVVIEHRAELDRLSNYIQGGY